MVSVLVGLRMANFSAVTVLSFVFDLITCVCDLRYSSSVGAGPVVVMAVAMSLSFGRYQLHTTRRAALIIDWGSSTVPPRPGFYQGQTRSRFV